MQTLTYNQIKQVNGAVHNPTPYLVATACAGIVVYVVWGSYYQQNYNVVGGVASAVYGLAFGTMFLNKT